MHTKTKQKQISAYTKNKKINKNQKNKKRTSQKTKINIHNQNSQKNFPLYTEKTKTKINFNSGNSPSGISSWPLHTNFPHAIMSHMGASCYVRIPEGSPDPVGCSLTV
jgi:outer membrane biosynthesis protein TonB